MYELNSIIIVNVYCIPSTAVFNVIGVSVYGARYTEFFNVIL